MARIAAAGGLLVCTSCAGGSNQAADSTSAVRETASPTSSPARTDDPRSAPAPAPVAAVPAAEPTVADLGTLAPSEPAPVLGDPSGVARTYVQQRLTYRYDDPAGYQAALTAPAVTTPEFAARSQPTEQDLGRLRTAQEVSTVDVGAVTPAEEAPSTATTQYLDVAATQTLTYLGAGSGAPQAGVWTLRLMLDPAGTWRVDAVMSTG